MKKKKKIDELFKKNLHYIFSPSMKNAESMNMQIFFISKVELRHWAVHSQCTVCAPEASTFHITLLYIAYWTTIGFQTSCDVTNHACRVHERDKNSGYKTAAECENRLLVSDSARTPVLCTVKAKQFNEHFLWGKGDFECSFCGLENVWQHNVRVNSKESEV